MLGSRRISLVTALGVLLSASQVGANPYLALLQEREAHLSKHRRTPRGVIALRGLFQIWNQVPPEEVERLIELARQRRSHPLVQGFGTYLSSLVAMRRGNVKEADQLRQRAGCITRWLICGPFDNPDDQGFEREYPVEQDLDRWPVQSRQYPGKKQRVRWRSLPPLQQPKIPVGSFLEPDREIVAYLQALVKSPKAMPVALRLGTSGSYKVFINGRVAGKRREARRPARADQDTIGLHLGRGVNRLVIKLASGDGPLNVFARLTRPDGAELEGITFIERAPATAALLGAGGDQKAPRVVDLGSWLEKGGDAPDLIRERTLYAVRVTPKDPSPREVDRILERWIQREPCAEAYLIRARIEQDPNKERRALQRALELDPDNTWALFRLAQHRARGGKPHQSARLLQRALKLDPRFFPAELERAETYRAAGLMSMAARMIDDLLSRHGSIGQVIRERADLALADNDLDRAGKLYQRFLAFNQDDISTLRTLSNIAVRRGKTKRGLFWLEEAVRLAPQLVFLRVDLARLLAGSGDTTGAIAEYKHALGIDPRSVRVLEEMGHLLHRAGRRTEALRVLRRALGLRPQNADLRAYLAHLAPPDPRGRAEHYRLDPLVVIARARQRKLDREPARVLLELMATEVHPSGQSRRLHQRLIQVGDAAGAGRVSSFGIPFNPERQSVTVKAARVHRVGGGISPPASQEEQDLSEPWAGVWYDLRAQVMQFAGLQAGDIIEIEYIVEDVAEDNLFAGYFGDLVFLQEDLPVQRFEVVLITPAERTFYVREPKTAGITRSVTRSGNRRVYRWSARDLGKVQVEPGMPGWSEVSDYLHVSTFKGYGELGRWYHNLIREQLRSTSTIGETARRIAGALPTEKQRIQAIHNFVAKSTRYVGLELGVHSYKPYPASQVLARKFGDCKDKATLMVALLEQLGIQGQIVLIRTRRRGDIDTSVASLAPFDHAVVYIPGHKVYLDATAEFSGTAEFPSQGQGVLALHIDPEQPELRRTSVQPARRNITRIITQMGIQPDGQVLVDERRTIAGMAAAKWRKHYQAADQRRQRYERALNSEIGGVTVKRVEMPAIESLEQPVQVVAEWRVKGLVQREGPAKLAVPITIQEANLSKVYGRLSRRRHPLQLDYPWTLEEEVRLRVPTGWRVSRAPRDRTLSSAYGSYKRAIKKTDNEIVIRQVTMQSMPRISTGAYPAFRRYLQQVDRLMSEKVSLER